MAHAPTLPEVPSAADDAVLEEALAEVDLKLSAWLSAISDAETRLRHLPADAGHSPVNGIPAIAAPALTKATRTLQADSKPPASPQMPAELTPSPAEALNDRSDGEDPRLGEVPGASPGDVIDQPTEPEPDADQILLESLDPEIRREIHVRQRCCNYRKSIRELLAELEAERSRRVEEGTTKSKPWWRKGK